jgi:hypothetical protein
MKERTPEMTEGERLILALSYAAGALSRQHHPGPGQIQDDQRFSRELCSLIPFLIKLLQQAAD